MSQIPQVWAWQKERSRARQHWSDLEGCLSLIVMAIIADLASEIDMSLDGVRNAIRPFFVSARQRKDQRKRCAPIPTPRSFRRKSGADRRPPSALADAATPLYAFSQFQKTRRKFSKATWKLFKRSYYSFLVSMPCSLRKALPFSLSRILSRR